MHHLSRRVIVMVTLIACTGIWMACDDEEETVEEPVEADVEENVPAEEEADESEETANAPRANPTDAPPDDEIGVLPDGIGVETGEEVELVSLDNADGDTVDLADLAADQTVMLVFYRGGWCPFCNFQIRELTEAHEQFEERGILPVAISVDQVEESAKSSAAYEIPFPVLSDPDLEAHKAFNVVMEVPAEEVEKLRDMGMDLEASSGRTHHSVAIPSIFVIDGDGVVRWAHANEDYSVRPTIEQLTAALDSLDLD